MTDMRTLIRREFLARKEFITGRVLTQPSITSFDVAGSTVWVVAVDVGGFRHLEDVPVKMVNGSRGYATTDSSVLLRRNTAGRYDIVGPADRSTGITKKKTYTIDTPTETSATDLGFTFRLETFIWYATAGPASVSAWADGLTTFPKLTITDADGNPVT